MISRATFQVGILCRLSRRRFRYLFFVALTVEQIAQEVSALPREERAKLADRLVEILDPTDHEPQRAILAAEALRRRLSRRSTKLAPPPFGIGYLTRA